jgi:hypothetical protein
MYIATHLISSFVEIIESNEEIISGRNWRVSGVVRKITGMSGRMKCGRS